MATASLLVYAGVKSYSLKGKLLSEKDLQMLAESRDLEELITRIKNTTYADSVSKVTKPYTAQKIELALRDRLADTHHSMMMSVGGSNILFAYYLRFIIRNLKIILKGKVLSREHEDIAASISLHAEELIHERDIVLKALVAKDVEETVTVLKSIGIGDEVDKAYSIYNEKKQIQILDVYFDKFFYENLSHVLRNSSDFSLHNLCGMEIDYYNMMCILRAKFWDLDENQIQNLLVPQISSSSKELLTRMISADSIKSTFNELLNTKYKNLVPQQENAIDAISEFEHAFDRRIFNAYNAEFVRIFNFSTIISIIKLLEYEVRNLCAITFAVEQKISADTVMNKVFAKEKE
ncbi:MAG: V-type ATPase subunit [Candidatus Nitrosotenuis sp.]|uniref:H(+)-transporting two-sector ATPase n=1 Tax=Candidatus Nitrosotenuis uzonensis TaxID=1407055 RepID=A0A812EWJ5_9ARCH|nr:V-type ATPase subunit [Candidatus Nitrosotenuis uzonensis]CAE6496485.1 H(+)-transporting two-sector ATPase [Candidatus Nitrosotenuis uzonensis]